MKRRTTEDWIVDSINYSLLFVITMATVYPFYYLVVISFNDGLDTVRGGFYLWPRSFSLDNYKVFFTDSRWLTALWMSLMRTVVGAILGVLLTSLVAYGLAYTNLMFKKVYMTIVIIAMFFSGGLIPFYVVLRELGLLNTFWVYIFPPMLNTFFLIIAISFYREIPSELQDSGRMDGASELVIFIRLIMPVSKPLLATMTLFLGVAQWNAWFDAAYFVRSSYLRTLAFRMMEVINQSTLGVDTEAAIFADRAVSVTSFSIQVTAMIVAVVPIICVYPFLQKYFVGGMMLGSVKG